MEDGGGRSGAAVSEGSGPKEWTQPTLIKKGGQSTYAFKTQCPRNLKTKVSIYLNLDIRSTTLTSFPPPFQASNGTSTGNPSAPSSNERDHCVVIQLNAFASIAGYARTTRTKETRRLATARSRTREAIRQCQKQKYWNRQRIS